MYLKSLKLKGFKSFADRIQLEFRSGVTVIVGPNGSGKSNIVDALSWVLGTQSTKMLRTGRMEDVIFAGTATRPSLGKTEVTLVIDNQERQLDLDLDEISITRRLYRDGSSDYELNGVGCRLLDIQDLLSDSGVGRHQHVIIGQGEIGKVLSASEEEHRAVIEEAAGILKHRRRKERAERRLERTDEDMLRLQDLLGEIGRQMRPLKRQARAAERYEGLRRRAVELRLYLGGEALAAHDRELTIATSEQARLIESLEADTDRVDTLTEVLAELTASSEKVGAELERDTSAAALLETSSERLRRIASVAHERLRALSSHREAVSDRQADLLEERETLDRELTSVIDELGDVQRLTNAAESRFRRLEDEERALASQKSLSPEGALAAVRGELVALEAARIRDERERSNIAKRLEQLAAQRDDELREVERINDEIRAADTEISKLQAGYQSASNQRTADQKNWAEAEKEMNESRLDTASAEARLLAIRDALDGRYDAEARARAESADGAIGSLTSQLDIPIGMERAVDAALGRWVDAVAFSGVSGVRDAVDLIKRSGGGSVPVVSAMSEGHASASDIAVSTGVDALIDRLGPSAHRGLATRLLGDVLLVEGWVSGWDLIAKHPALRAVTPEGDLISVSGVHIANPDGAGPAMLEAAELALDECQTKLARAESIHTAARRDFDTSRDQERTALEKLEGAEAGLAGRSEAMARFQQSVGTITHESERLEERYAGLIESIEATKSQAFELRSRMAALEGEEAERMRIWESLDSRSLVLAADREAARSEWQEAAGRLRGIVERERLLTERRERIDLEMARVDTGTESSISPAILEEVESLARVAVGTIENRLTELRDRQAGHRAKKADVAGRLESVRAEHDHCSTDMANARGRIGELDVRITELRLKREAVVEAIRRDADADVPEAMGSSKPDVPEGTDLAELLDSTLAQLGRLGPINPLAATEFHDLEERHDFLSAQMVDVETSRDELRKVISALESEIETRFQAAFAEVATAYEGYFEVLFPGGKGRIRLVDGDDPHSGVSIEAQPLGKKLTQMTLLSGGERSLAALAFLFAVFEARPSPFYVLDEVEAALDDANLRRFLRIVEEFRQRAQLLIVTHQQQTMEAADVLYGVTMEPGGSSQAVRKDMTSVAVERVA